MEEETRLKLLPEIKKEEALQQIDIRKKLIGEMVGNLYPSVLSKEINKLWDLHYGHITEKDLK